MRRFVVAIATIISVGLVASACGFTVDEAAAEDASAPATATAAVNVMDPSVVHDIAVAFDEDAYDAMIDTYAATEDKEWIEATVMIDGVTYEQVGLRLKGNSSLRGLGDDRAGEASTVSADDPSGLPWLIRFDKYVEGQNHDGLYDVVIRSNNTETSLNEAVALDLLELAGLASQDAIAVAFSVNGSESTLRLAIEHPDDVWMDDNFADDGALYKAESTGDYSYRGDDPEAYDEVFDQEAGKDNEDLTPLIEFLDFINNTDDATFNAELADHLDIESFATYLAMQDLIDNFDDINGPGNNSYLYYDSETGIFTVVAWDHNLAFGVRNNDAFGPGGAAAAVPEWLLPAVPAEHLGAIPVVDNPMVPVSSLLPEDHLRVNCLRRDSRWADRADRASKQTSSSTGSWRTPNSRRSTTQRSSNSTRRSTKAALPPRCSQRGRRSWRRRILSPATQSPRSPVRWPRTSAAKGDRRRSMPVPPEVTRRCRARLAHGRRGCVPSHAPHRPNVRRWRDWFPDRCAGRRSLAVCRRRR